MSLKQQPLVSIVTPVYNGGEFLKETIESVLAQDYPYIEYIVLDDGSKDNTKEILAQYTDRIQWQTQSNIGQSATLNKGWAMCKGELLGYLNSDDILLPNAISSLVQLMLMNSSAAVVYPNCDLINLNGSVFQQEVSRPFDYEKLVLQQECYIGPGALFKREFYKHTGGWREDIKSVNDIEFWMRMGLLGEFIMHPHALARFRIHPNSVSYGHSTREIADERLKIVTAFYQSNHVPQTLLGKEHIALSSAHFISSRIHLRAGRVGLSLEHLIKAKRLNSEMKLMKSVGILARVMAGRLVRWFLWRKKTAKNQIKRCG